MSTKPNAARLRQWPASKPRPNLPAEDTQAHDTAATSDSGQATVILLLMLSTFLLAMLAFAVDLTAVWFHRQATKSAADAACLAAASDMLAINLGATPTGTGFTPGTNSDCVSSPAAVPCKYAKFNGYNGAGLNTNAASNSVAWSFISSVPGVVTPTGPKAPKYPFLQVNIIENVKTTFMGLLGTKYQQVAATSQCGEAFVLSAPPLVVLDPVGAPSVSLSSSGFVKILGGPARSIQINSTSTTAVTNNLIDTTGAGPNLTGGDVGVTGGPTTEPTNFALGTGRYIPYALPVADPFSTVLPPTTPTLLSLPAAGVPGTPYQTSGCPDTAGCNLYTPGYYGSGIKVKGFTGIFLPGVYVVDNGFTMDSNSAVRNAYVGQKQAVLTTDGVMFYIRTGPVTVVANSGRTVADSVSPTLLSCDGTLPKGIPSTALSGSILSSQCVDDGTYTTVGGTGTYSSAGVRGLLFFQAHDNPNNTVKNPGYDGQGGGALALSGTEYFHNSTTHTSTMHFGGNPSGTTYLLGYIVTDDLQMNGTPALAMVLSAKKLFITLKVGLFK